MIKLKDIFSFPVKRILKCAEWEVRADWFPELSGIWDDSTEMREAVDQDARLRVDELLNKYFDHRRSALMCAIWFDGKPAMVVQNAGREGDDHKKRWVVDKALYAQLLVYLATLNLTTSESTDYVDPEMEIYPEEALYFYGSDYSSEFGVEVEPLKYPKGILAMSNDRSLLPTVAHDHCLVMLHQDIPDLPRYVRRGGFVMENLRLLTVAELDAGNPRIMEVNREQGFDRVYLCKPCARPLDHPVLKI